MNLSKKSWEGMMQARNRTNSLLLLLVIAGNVIWPGQMVHADQNAGLARSESLFSQTSRFKAAMTNAADPQSNTQLQGRGWRYRLCLNDTFAATFSITTEFNQVVRVHPDGYVTLLGVGDLHVADKTLPELTGLIQAAYATMVSPQVITVELKDFERPYYVVGGEVGQLGKFELRGDTTIAEAIQIAGGFRDSAKHSQVLLFRKVSDSWLTARMLNLKHMLRDGNLNEDLHLRPGDLVYESSNHLLAGGCEWFSAAPLGTPSVDHILWPYGFLRLFSNATSEAQAASIGVRKKAVQR